MSSFDNCWCFHFILTILCLIFAQELPHTSIYRLQALRINLIVCILQSLQFICVKRSIQPNAIIRKMTGGTYQEREMMKKKTGFVHIAHCFFLTGGTYQEREMMKKKSGFVHIAHCFFLTLKIFNSAFILWRYTERKFWHLNVHSLAMMKRFKSFQFLEIPK